MNDTTGTRPYSPKIDRTYSKPKLKLPPGACDTHFHFIGPQKQFPLKPNHVFSHLEFEDTPIEDWLKLQDALVRIETEIPTPETLHLVAFIRRSQRGICRE